MLRSGFTIKLGELGDSLESSKLRASVIQFGKKKKVLDQFSFSPDVLAAGESWKETGVGWESPVHQELWRPEEGGGSPRNGIRAIHLSRGLPSCMLYHPVSTQQQLPLLASRASQYHLSFWKTAAAAQPGNNTTSVLGAQFLGALITSKIASLSSSQNTARREGGGSHCSGTILHTVQTRQGQVK